MRPTAVHLGQISRTGATQVIRLAWTLADLAAKVAPGPAECREAFTFYLGAVG